MDNITYEAVTRAILPDYEKLILPVVFRELLTDAEPIENGFLCIGARVAGKPVAAIVVFLEEYGDLDLRSLYVLTAYRRKRIASSLTLRVVQVAAASFKFDEEQEEISFKVMYSLPEPLKKILRHSCRLMASILRNAWEKASSLTAVTLRLQRLLHRHSEKTLFPRRKRILLLWYLRTIRAGLY